MGLATLDHPKPADRRRASHRLLLLTILVCLAAAPAFYERLFKNDMPFSAALREAQLTIANQPRWRDPYFWAAFIIEGEWQPEPKPDSPGKIFLEEWRRLNRRDE